VIDWQEANDPDNILRERGRLLHQSFGRGTSIDSALRYIGVPHHLVERKLRDFRGTYMDQHASDFLAQEMGPGLVMVGKAGTGKTSFAGAMCRTMLKNAHTARFITMDDFTRHHTGRIDLSKNSVQYDDFAERMGEWELERWRMEQVYELLVIDEVQGHASVPLFVLDELGTLVRKRVGSAGCFTVMTSNRPLDDLTDYLGERFGSFVRRELRTVRMTEPARAGE
jgi:DNA replication protein DnaC